MTDTHEGSYAIREIQTGEIKPVKLACDPNEAEVKPDQELVFRQGGEWVPVVQRRTHPWIKRFDEGIAELLALRDDMESDLDY